MFVEADSTIQRTIEQWTRTSLPFVPVPPIDSQDQSNLKNAITQNVNLIKEYESKITALWLDSVRCLAILSSARAIPTEIIAHILEEHLNNTPDSPDSYPHRLAPLEVCRAWRNAAISNPSCWTKLDITISGCPSVLQRLNMQLTRARRLKVDLTLRVTNPLPEGPTAWWVGELCKIKDQVEHLLVKFADKLNSYAEHGDCFTQRLMLSFLQNQNTTLTRLHLRNLHISDVGFAVCLLPALTELYLNTANVKDLFRLSCPSLRILTLDGLLSRPGDRTSAQQFVAALGGFPRLKALRLSAAILVYWIAPADARQNSVETIIIQSPRGSRRAGGMRGVSIRPFRHFLQSFPKATTLALSSVTVGLEDRRAARSHLPVHGGIQEVLIAGYIAACTVIAVFETLPNLKRSRFVHVCKSSDRQPAHSEVNERALVIPNAVFPSLNLAAAPAAQMTNPLVNHALHLIQLHQLHPNHHLHQAHHNHQDQHHGGVPVFLLHAPDLILVQSRDSTVVESCSQIDPAMITVLSQLLRQLNKRRREHPQIPHQPIDHERDSQRPELCPKLEQIEFSGFKFGADDFDKLLDGLKVREELTKVPPPVPSAGLNPGDAMIVDYPDPVQTTPVGVPAKPTLRVSFQDCTFERGQATLTISNRKNLTFPKVICLYTSLLTESVLAAHHSTLA